MGTWTSRLLLAGWVFALWAGVAHSVWAQGSSPVEVRSPDGRNIITLWAGNSGRLHYRVDRDGQSLISPSALGPKLVDGGDIGKGAELVDVRRGKRDENFELPWGKARMVTDRCATATLFIESPADIRWEIEARAYDDGVAFRYVLPAQAGRTTFELSGEATEFRINGNPTAIYSGYDNFTSSHEALFSRTPVAEIPAEKLLEMPLLFTWRKQAAALTEGRVRDFAGMYLQHDEKELTVLRARLSPLPTRPEVYVAGKPRIASPWRVVLLGDHAGKLLESNLLLCLNDEATAAGGDFSWAKPGKTTFHWWNGEFEEFYKDPNSGREFEKHKEYIDFCAKHTIAYHSVTGDGRPWYVQKEPGYAPPQPDADILTPRPELRLPEIIEYARDHNVGIRLWVHWKSLEGDMLEKAFSRYEEWGVAGLMVDFLDRDDQEMIEWSDRMLESAARHKLHIQIHGSPKFSGEQRTFPNLFNREGVMNLEYLKWSDMVTPQHSVDVAYTRALAGPVDYHLGGFRSASQAEFKPRYVLPVVMGTRCHHLALYVVYENPMPMVADAPSAYEGQKGFDFISEVPTTWDETRFVAGEPGEFVVLARRRGDAWYLGGINNWTRRDLTIPLDFLGSGQFMAKAYVDGDLSGDRPNEATVKEPKINKAAMPVTFAPGGGIAAVFRKL
jgi:alpha-glucosidase